MKHINLTSEKDCCGCGVCREVCPVNAITLNVDKTGFYYPVFDDDICIDCGLCEKKCPVIHSNNIINTKQPSFWGGFNKDENIRENSSSGGMFSVFAKSVLQNNGIVVGAVFDREFGVHHVCISTEVELARIRGSKYVESSLFDVWPVMISYLKQGKYLLFSGTPCQIAAAKSICQKWVSQIVFIEVICFGVPSSLFFRSYLEWRERKAHVRTIDFKFRYKKYKNDRQVLKQIGDTKSVYYDHGRDPYMKAFYRKLSLRPSCYACRFKGFPRHADITLGDFWGIESRCPEFDHQKGVSLVIVNTDKGESLLQQIRDNLSIKEFDKDFAIKKNPMVMESAKEPEKRDNFWKDFNRVKLKKLFMKYDLMPSFWMRAYSNLRIWGGKIFRIITNR